MNYFKSNFIDLIKIIFKIIINIPKIFYTKLKLSFLIYHKPKIIIKNDTRYRDLYKNGRIEIYENINFTPEQRANDLLKKMTIEEKVGQMFHPPISINGGSISEIMNLASGKGDTTKSLILNKAITHFNLYGSPNPLQLAKKLNKLQKIAERSRLGIPLTISSDPIHEVPRGGGVAAFSLEGFSKWPSQLGFASTRDPEIIKEYAEIAREEY
jgi:Beta-glucosidase-related glycosidases